MKVVRVQAFLNPAEAYDSGAVVAHVQDPIEGRIGVDAAFSVWDCSRKVTLEFGTETVVAEAATKKAVRQAQRSIKERRRKVKLLRQAVIKFCDAMDKLLDSQEEKLSRLEPEK